MLKLIKLVAVIFVSGSIVACTSAASKHADATVPGIDTQKVAQQEIVSKPEKPAPEHHETMRFIAYNDDGDDFQLIARKGDSTYYFVNNDDADRSLNRGDQIAITWKKGTITMAGDDDAAISANLLVSAKKLADGTVSVFRKQYGKQVKYTWAADENYSKSYLDKIYLQVEYYLSTTENTLLHTAIENRDEVTYSVESKERDGRKYVMIGIGVSNAGATNIVQWLYIDKESDQLYAYDLPNDNLVPYSDKEKE